jgi:hypothetical protein
MAVEPITFSTTPSSICGTPLSPWRISADTRLWLVLQRPASEGCKKGPAAKDLG